MKKYLVFILVVGAFILISPFKVSAAVEEEWSQKLDLSDSVSSSIIELDDGVIVIQYEGGASDNNVLRKYDFDGNEVWTIKNDYGYEIASLGDSFLVYQDTDAPSITKISSSGKVLWTKNYSGFSSSEVEVVDLPSGFILEDYYTVFLYDENGNLLKSISKTDIYSTVFPNDSSRYQGNFVTFLSQDGNSIFFYYTCYHSITGGTNGYYQVVAKYSLDLNYESSTKAYVGDQNFEYLTKAIETENNYIISGNYTLVFNKNGQIDKVLNLSMLDFKYIDGYIYAYLIKKSDDYRMYNSYIVKFDENMNVVTETQLPYSFSTQGLYTSTYDGLLNSTGYASLRDRCVFNNESGNVGFIVLNSSITVPNASSNEIYANSVNSSFGVVKYRLVGGESSSNVNDDGIINNIFQNPETSSIAVVIAFVVVILLGGIGFYFGYKKKKAKNM